MIKLATFNTNLAVSFPLRANGAYQRGSLMADAILSTIGSEGEGYGKVGVKTLQA